MQALSRPAVGRHATVAGARRGLTIALPLLLLLLAVAADAEGVGERLGAAHIAGRYNFTSTDYLNEGADQLLALGTRVIKVWVSLDPKEQYPFNSSWGPKARDHVQVLKKPYFKALFAKPFSTYILVVNIGGAVFQDGMTPSEVADTRRRFHDLASYLLATYAGTGKTFIVQNWEGDHLLEDGLAEGAEPDPLRLGGMIAWLNARQDGIDLARREARAVGVTVANAVEVNALAAAMQGKVTMTNDVLQYTHADLYSYSSWDIGYDPPTLVRALDYLASRAPPSALYGERNIYLGEFGASQDLLRPGQQQSRVIRDLTEAALAWGARYVVYWQLYSNERTRAYSGRPHNDDLRGYWLVRPDGSKTDMWKFFSAMVPAAIEHGTLRADTGRYLHAADAAADGDGVVSASSTRRGRWETFALRGVRPSADGALHDGDAVAIQAHNGLYLVGVAGKNGGLQALATKAGQAQQFIVHEKDVTAGPPGPAAGAVVRSGDQVYFAAAPGRFLGLDPSSARALLSDHPATLRLFLEPAAATNAAASAGRN